MRYDSQVMGAPVGEPMMPQLVMGAPAGDAGANNDDNSRYSNRDDHVDNLPPIDARFTKNQ